ncbi:glycosyltransferase [Leuconostocaceae bacterium ESL0723]|nr:glycosyltransferase [Leuconostocaceae bacterium ESL0723]
MVADSTYSVSVMTAMYNAEATIDHFLDQVSRQNYADFEWVLVDDGSTDQTVSRVQAFMTVHPELPLRLITQTNQGVAAARNRALAAANKQYFMFADVDDNFPTDFISGYVAGLKAADTELAIYNLRLVNPAGQMVGEKRNLAGRYSGLASVANLLEQKSGGFLVGMIAHRRLWQDLRLRPALRFLEDEEVFVRLLLRCESVQWLDQSYYDYVQHDQSAIHRADLATYQNGYQSVLAIQQDLMEANQPALVALSELRVQDLLVPLLVLAWRQKQPDLANQYRTAYLNQYHRKNIPRDQRLKRRIKWVLIKLRLKPVLLFWYRRV